jgi:plastocyanin
MVRIGVVSIAALAWSGAAWAGAITAEITTEAGAPLADAVVYAVPAAGPVAAAGRTAQMIQENQEFVPFVLPVQVGTEVEFPNRDSFRHHVYSFSPAKRFELKLFSGNERQVVTFDQPGVVALGCNIHDNMLAYIFAVPTPYFAKTGEDGKAALNVPAGAYTVKVWHPNQKAGSGDGAVTLTVAADGAAAFKAALALKGERRTKKPGAKDETDY